MSSWTSWRWWRPARDEVAAAGARRMDVNRVIAEVAARHRVRLDPDDPALVLVTVAELMLAEARADFRVAVREAARELAMEAVVPSAAIAARGGWWRRWVLPVGIGAAMALAGMLVGLMGGGGL